MWNRLLTLGSISAHIPRDAIPSLELPQSYHALRDDLVQPWATTLSNICRRNYPMTVDAIKKKSPSRNKVNLAWDRWTSTNTLAIMSVVAYYINQYWSLRDVQLVFDEVDCLFLPP